MKRSRRQAGSTLHRIGGFTLIELMVAMTLSLVLVAGVLAVMLNSRQTYEVHDYTADMQENARFAMYILSRELRAAGYYGCSNRLTNSIPGVLGGLGRTRFRRQRHRLGIR
jgi:type IV pilus assembly protein PilW